MYNMQTLFSGGAGESQSSDAGMYRQIMVAEKTGRIVKTCDGDAHVEKSLWWQ